MDPIEGIPSEILEEINELEMFVINKEKLNHIVDKFVEQLEKGLSKNGGTIPMFPTWVLGYANGDEQGTYLALDIGGTNFRLCKIDLYGKRNFDIVQSNYNISPELKKSNSDVFFGFIAKCLKDFLREHHEIKKDIILGFTFSYPCIQDRIDQGILIRWTKEFDIKGVEGHDVVEILMKAIEKENIPVKVAALVNDTTGTLIASNYVDNTTKLGVIFGTGSNAAYMEQVKYIPKIQHLNLPPDLHIAINCEWGSFDNEHLVLPRTKYDIQLDLESIYPGQQTFEKMVSGFYLGEILRQVLLDLYEKKKFFKEQCLKMLKYPYSLETSYLSIIELDTHEDLIETYKLFKTQFNIECTLFERRIIKKITELIAKRSAYLSACGIAAICKKKDIKECSVGVDGSVINKYPGFKKKVCEALKCILESYGDKIRLVAAQDGSGVGAAIIAAITTQRKKKGEFIHI
ncbi:hypothetical protein T552_02926 [Pneumocystis carinii B80]|uniref:Phosphotransferase n=1 Tax=Pneumocystis carinii (strain B80) TaxID=1408658 RepID=A0A0W4ZDI3_PNEC8|nr:hypothetical protein T552_02926 [Pneumocystis carinii B80]KTW26447.1 hypothetical protein T552_02926 [Pneumocystis carinii B80]